MLRRGLDMAHRFEAVLLATQARQALVNAGGVRGRPPPRRATLTVSDSLTASERRVAELAARGMTNREVADELFVTAKTVEAHLTKAYRKLHVASRTELAARLAA